MKNHPDAIKLIEAILSGERSLDGALEELLAYQDAALTWSDAHAVLCYFNMGQTKMKLDLPGNPTVADVVKEYGLESVAPLVNDQQTDRNNEVRYPVGTQVEFCGDKCRVIGRRKVTIFAMPREDDFEIYLESLEGTPMYFVGESMVRAVEA